MDERVLILAQGRDGPLTCEVLGKARFACHACASVAELCREMEAGAGAVILAEELLTATSARCLVEVLSRQPPWSDLPLLVVANPQQDVHRLLQAFDALGNVTFLHRPLAIDTIITATRAALRARRRQCQVRDLLRDREEANRRKDEFLAMLAHELRNPLAPVRNIGQVFRLRSGPELASAVGILERQVAHMARLVDDLLDVSRLTRGKIKLHRETVSLNDVIDQAVQVVQPLVQEKRHRLDVVMPDEPLRLSADPTRLVQVVTNLLHNAAKYTDPGGRITLRAERDGGHVVLRVRDDGVGIGPDDLPHVFELFAQADRPLDRSQGGLGIGLTVVQRLVALHGGTVAVHSDGPGRGSEFTIRLPATHAAPEADGKGDADGVHVNGSADGQPLRVLVVEDSRDGAASLQFLLELWGYAVEVAHDGIAGLEAAQRGRPDVVLLDIGLPGLDGYEVARRLRALPPFAHTPLVAITGYSEAEDRARTAGFDLHLAKPPDPEELRRYLEAARAGRAEKVSPR